MCPANAVALVRVSPIRCVPENKCRSQITLFIILKLMGLTTCNGIGHDLRF